MSDNNVKDSSPDSSPTFVMMTCAHGAERLVQSCVADHGWRLAFSRPGFVTAKHNQSSIAPPSGTFIRTSSLSLGSVRGEAMGEMLMKVETLLRDAAMTKPFDHLHVFPRDRTPIGRFDFEPGVDEVAKLVAEQLHAKISGSFVSSTEPNQTADPWQNVLDMVLVEPNQWMLGYHRANDIHGRWPGGVQPIEPTYPPVSRAYFKAAEAIAWSGFDVVADDLAIEIGSAPGGACGRLLELGCRVMGVDPAEMDPRIDRHPRFEHRRARGGDIPRRAYENARWLLVDSNVRPDQTLTTVENIVKHAATDFEGLLLTLKIGGYEHADRTDGWIRKIQTWNPKHIAVKQLARNKVEVCLAVRMR